MSTPIRLSRAVLLAAVLAVCLGMNKDVFGAEPQLAIELVPKITFQVDPGTVTEIQYATDLTEPVTWQPLQAVTTTNGTIEFVDASPGVTERYYQAVTIATNPGPFDMVWIQPGTFTMGSPDSEGGHNTNELQTTVTLTKGFWIGGHEVTRGEWEDSMGTRQWVYYKQVDDFLPADNISWQEATAFCGVVTDAERAAGRVPPGYIYRLPTEAEWEYACRAGTTTRFYYGDDLSQSQLDSYAWYDNNSFLTVSYAPRDVAAKLPNAWGLYDMYGNVIEWCADFYDLLPGGEVVDPIGPPTGTLKAVRGGFYGDPFLNLRSAARKYGEREPRYPGVGLRLVLGPLLP